MCIHNSVDIEGFDYERDLGMPGEFPYTRGVQPTMYRGRFGQCVCTQVSQLLKNPTNVTVT